MHACIHTYIHNYTMYVYMYLFVFMSTCFSLLSAISGDPSGRCLRGPSGTELGAGSGGTEGEFQHSERRNQQKIIDIIDM